MRRHFSRTTSPRNMSGEARLGLASEQLKNARKAFFNNLLV
jgi:hypothetical protein